MLYAPHCADWANFTTPCTSNERHNDPVEIPVPHFDGHDGCGRDAG